MKKIKEIGKALLVATLIASSTQTVASELDKYKRQLEIANLKIQEIQSQKDDLEKQLAEAQGVWLTKDSTLASDLKNLGLHNPMEAFSVLQYGIGMTMSFINGVTMQNPVAAKKAKKRFRFWRAKEAPPGPDVWGKVFWTLEHSGALMDTARFAYKWSAYLVERLVKTNPEEAKDAERIEEKLGKS